MELRTAQRIAALLVLTLPLAAATVWHKHARGGAQGSLDVSATGIVFREQGKHEDHSRAWKWEDLQQVLLSPDEMQVLTYEDRKWQFGRDRAYTFQDLPEGFASSIAAILRTNLQSRFVAAMAAAGAAEWQVPARLLEGNKGVLGVISYRPGVLSFAGPGQSRTWPVEYIENINSSGPLQLMVATYEKYGRLHGGNRQVRFQLRAPMAPEQYQELWRAVNRVQGLQVLETK